MIASPRRLLTALCIVVLSLGASARVIHGQSIVDRIKKAAEDAKKKGENQPQPTPSGTTPAQPNANGKGPATPATPAKKADAAPAAAGTLPKSSAKVEEQNLVTSDGSNQLHFTVSLQGSHAAAVVLRGSRQVVMFDGMDGPRFDDIIGGAGGLIFSPDGTRLAYVGRQGADYVYIVDGKELLREPVVKHPHVANQGSTVSTPHFTENGRHVYFDLYTQPDPNITNGYERFVFDGVQEMESNSVIEPVFGGGGDHYAYMFEPAQKRGTLVLAVDGKVAPYNAGAPQFTADGLHLITKRVVPGPQGGVTDVLIDGKAVMRAIEPVIYTTPVGSGFAAVVHQGNRGSGNSFLTVGTQQVQGTDCKWGGSYTIIAFSPDAKHWAALCEADSASKWFVIDGKKGQEYQQVYPEGFLADGRFVYTATMRAQRFVVVGTQESNAYNSLLTITPETAGANDPNFKGVITMRSAQLSGNHVGFVAGTGNSSANTIVVDGKSMQREAANNIEFSPDGSRYAFTFGVANSLTVNVDGTDTQGPALLFKRPALATQARTDRAFVFSPDSKHIVYFTRRANGQTGIVVDGTFTALQVNYPMNPTFTPDSRHLIWMDRTGATGTVVGQTVVYVDGRAAAQMDTSSLNDIPGTWNMAADGTLTAIGQSGDSLHRYRITLPADTSIDNLTK
jgi:Tol biopolymer transport system component